MSKLSSTESVSKFIAILVMNTPSAEPQLDLFFNKPAIEAILLSKSSSLAETLGPTKFEIIIAVNFVTLCCNAEVQI
jgi:hypothetical protein